MEPERWPAAPNQDQMRRAGAEALRRSIIHPNRDYDINVEQKRIGAVLAAQEACLEAHRTNQPHYDDAAFEALWHSDEEMVSEAAVTARLDELKEQHAMLVGGGGHAAMIIGRGAGDGAEDRAMAVMIAEEHIALLDEALACEGRNLKINQIRVTQTRVKANEAAIPF